MQVESRPHPILGPLVRGFNRALVAGQLKVRCEGELPATGTFIYAPTHQHALDASVLLAMHHKDWRIMAAVERFAGPEAPLLRAVGAYPIDRDHPAPASIKETFRLLKQGKSVVMFPEGSISTDGHVHPLKDGAARIAIKSDCDGIVPIGIGYTSPAATHLTTGLLGGAVAVGCMVVAQLSGSPALRAVASTVGGCLAGVGVASALSGPRADANDPRFVGLVARRLGAASLGGVVGAVCGLALSGAPAASILLAAAGGAALAHNLEGRPEVRVEIGAVLPVHDGASAESLTTQLEGTLKALKEKATGSGGAG